MADLPESSLSSLLTMHELPAQPAVPPQPVIPSAQPLAFTLFDAGAPKPEPAPAPSFQQLSGSLKPSEPSRLSSAINSTLRQPRDSWESGLEALRRSRGEFTPLPVPPSDVFGDNRPEEVLIAEASAGLNPRQKHGVYRSFLRQWQEANQIASEPEENMLLLEEAYLAATDAILASEQNLSVREEVLLHVNLEENHDLPESQAPEWFSGSLKEAASLASETAAAESLARPVIVQVVNPFLNEHAAPRFVINETEFIGRLHQRLLPHLQAAVAGMVKMAVQKHMVLMTQSLQQHVGDEALALVDDVLQHELRHALDELKSTPA